MLMINCDKCTTLYDRKQQLSLQGRCFICLKVGYLFKNCDSYKKCYYCKRAGHHNRCICPKQFARSSEAPTSDQSFVTIVYHIRNNTQVLLFLLRLTGLLVIVITCCWLEERECCCRQQWHQFVVVMAQ